MVEISQFEYSFSPSDNYISELCDLPQIKQSKVIDVMLTERFICQYRFNFRDDQTIVFAGKTCDSYGQPIIDCRFVLNGYQQLLPRQIITGNNLPNVTRVDLYQDD
jgi:hypothetical protein